MSCLSATLTNAVFAYLCICVFVFVYLQVRHPGTLFLRSLYHHLSENVWFVWSKTSYSGDKRRCYQAGRRRTNDEQTMEDRATQPLGCWKAEFRNISTLSCSTVYKSYIFSKLVIPTTHSRKKAGSQDPGSFVFFSGKIRKNRKNSEKYFGKFGKIL